jgi:hypothetical protein
MVNHMDKTQVRKSFIRVLFSELPKLEQLDLFCELNCILNSKQEPLEVKAFRKVFGGLIA